MKKLLVLCVAAVAACGPSVKTITLEPANATIGTRGGTITLRATPKDEKGAAVANASIQWASSDAGIATVDKGTVTALKSGEVTVTATVGAAKSVARVLVSIPANVAVEPGSLEIKAIGQTASLATRVTDDAGRPASAPIVWSTSNDKVATVVGGVVTARGAGTAIISASAGSARGQTSVTVAPAEIAKIVVDPAKGTIAKAGATLQLKAKAVDAKGADVVGVPVEWSSSDDKIATVTATGLVTGVKKGAAKITAKAGDKSAVSAVTVK